MKIVSSRVCEEQPSVKVVTNYFIFSIYLLSSTVIARFAVCPFVWHYSPRSKACEPPSHKELRFVHFRFWAS